MSILDSFFDGKVCVLGHWLKHEEYPGHIQSLRGGGPKGALAIFFFPRGSRVCYYSRSHTKDIAQERGGRLLPETSRSNIVEAGCKIELETKEFARGGL